MASPAPLAPPPPAENVDMRVRLSGVSWRDYEALLAMRGERSTPRLTYLEGEIELMNPSRQHENLKTRFARLIEAWAEEAGVMLEGSGSWTLRSEQEERGAEADECYVIGRPDGEEVDAPDIAVEVIWTSGGLNKLEVYRRLGVREVWIWRDQKVSFFVLHGDEYESVSRSELLAELDPELIERCMAESSQTTAVRALRRAMRNG